jgi:hypothetical protein
MFHAKVHISEFEPATMIVALDHDPDPTSAFIAGPTSMWSGPLTRTAAGCFIRLAHSLA